MKKKLLQTTIGIIASLMITACASETEGSKDSLQSENQQEAPTPERVEKSDSLLTETGENVSETVAEQEEAKEAEEESDCEVIHLDGFQSEIYMFHNEPDPGKYRKFMKGAEEFAAQYVEEHNGDPSMIYEQELDESQLYPQYVYMTDDWKVYIGKGYRYGYASYEPYMSSIIYCPDLDIYIKDLNADFSVLLYTKCVDVYGDHRDAPDVYCDDFLPEKEYDVYFDFEWEYILEHLVDFRAEIAKYNGEKEIFSAHFPLKCDNKPINEENLEQFLSVFDKVSERVTDEITDFGERYVVYEVK